MNFFYYLKNYNPIRLQVKKDKQDDGEILIIETGLE